MTHSIDPDRHYVAGESVTWEFTIEAEGSAKDVTGADVTWLLLPRRGADVEDAALTDADDGVSVDAVDASAGRIDLDIDQDVTDGLGGGRYWQRLVVDDAADGKQIWGGLFPIARP